MKKLLLSLVAVGIGISSLTYAYPVPPQLIRSGGSAWVGTYSNGLKTRTMDCWFQTTGDTIPVQIIWRNFIVNSSATLSFMVRYPGAVHMTFTGTVVDTDAELTAYVNNNDYAGSYAKSILGVACYFE